MPFPGYSNKQGQTWHSAPRGLGIKDSSGVRGVWLYTGEYVTWSYQYDLFTGEKFVIGYQIHSHGVSSSLEN